MFFSDSKCEGSFMKGRLSAKIGLGQIIDFNEGKPAYCLNYARYKGGIALI